MTIQQHFSTMQNLIPDRESGGVRLHLGQISRSVTLPDFDRLIGEVVALQRPASVSKMARYGYITSRFVAHQHPYHPDRGVGMWRTAIGEIDEISALVIDVDNHRPEFPLTTWDAIADHLDVQMFGYSSASATPDQPRFRAIIELSRMINRVECRQLMATINKKAGNHQLDMSMADRAHYAIAPGYGADFSYQDGPPLIVDDWLQTCADEIADGCPYLAVAAVSRRLTKPSVRPTSPADQPGRHYVDQSVTFDPASPPVPGDPATLNWLSDSDIADYVTATSGHWQAMFVVLRRVFRRAGGRLTTADMALIAARLDSFADDYFTRKYPDRDLIHRIEDAMAIEDQPHFRRQRL